MTDREALVAPLLLNYDNNPEEAVRVFRHAIDTGVSRHPDVLVVFALHLLATSNWEEAEAVLRRALDSAPKSVLALYNLGYLLHVQNRDVEAEPLFRQVLALEPTHVDAMINLANTLQRLMRRDEGLALIRQAASLAPDNYLPAYFELFEATYDVKSTDAEILYKAKHAANLRCGDAKTRLQPLLGKAWRIGDRPLKVGFVSGDLKSHPVGFFLQGWLPHADRGRLSLHAFSMLDVDDVTSQRLRPQFDTWQNIAKMSDDEVQALTAQLSIDVLVDLSGHTDMNRLPLFTRRAAPVQISWLGWYTTTGVANMDYFLTDRISSPESSLGDYTEQLLYLPETRLCLCEPIFAPPVSPLSALQNKHITFGSLQSLLKITDATLVLWRQVLEKIPNACLQICCRQFEKSDLLLIFEQRLSAFEMPLDRIRLLPPLSYSAYLDGYQSMDVMLDTIPFSGGTTTAEALWMGVPTITMLGNTLIARQGASLMSAAGLPSWIAESSEDYVAKAVYWSEHLDELAQLRAGLREQVRASPLFDSPKFANAFTEAIESAYNAKLLLQPLRDI